MNVAIKGRPAFAYLEVELDPGESIVAESGAMSSMSGDLGMDARFNGGPLRGMARKWLGGESLFVNTFQNRTSGKRRLTLVQTLPGDMMEMELKGGAWCLQPGAYVASTPGITLGLRWAGIVSGLAKEGFFKMEATGTGKLWYGGYGGLSERQVDGEYIVDSSHLVAYEPQMKLKMQLAGGIFSSIFGGEGLVTRVEGKGRIVIQTRSLDTLAGWLSTKLF